MKACTKQEITDLVFLARNGVGRRARPQRLLERTVESVGPYGQSKEGAKQTKTCEGVEHVEWATNQVRKRSTRTAESSPALELQATDQSNSRATPGHSSPLLQNFGTPTHHPERQETIRYTEFQGRAGGIKMRCCKDPWTKMAGSQSCTIWRPARRVRQQTTELQANQPIDRELNKSFYASLPDR